MIRFTRDITDTLRAIDACDYGPPDVAVRCLILAEDRRFYFHLGVDPIGILRATWMCVIERRLQGASTIEAQLFRTISGRRNITLRRKLQEAVAATLISLMRNKREIAATYLHSAHFGFKSPGLEAAAEKLGFETNRLSLFQACDLISRLKRPSARSIDEPTNALLKARSLWLFGHIMPSRSSPDFRHSSDGNSARDLHG